MKLRFPFIALTILALAAGCRESVVDTKPAAEVTDTTAMTTTTSTPVTAFQPTPGATVGNVIKDKSKIEFVGAKVTRDHNGKFNAFDGWIEYAAGKPSRVAFQIDLGTLQADDEKLTGHLKSADFFDVAKYPKATFTSTSLTEAAAGAAGGATYTLKGTLDMHGVAKEVTIPVVTSVTPQGLRATSEFTINRHDWGISYKGAADDLIKDNVLIKLDLMFPPVPAA
ncbi:MAG: YceI family protein [Thermoanaerobaculia bacterium]|nr:YceI family protein [Thermoanaerobaculia bacterium]